MIDILLTASITGGIIIVLWYLSYPLSKKLFKSSWHYTILKITMIFMLFPISIFTPMINNVFAGLFVKPDIPYISEQIQKINIDTETIESVNSVLTNFVFSDNQPIIQTETEPIKTSVPDIPYLQITWIVVGLILFLNGIRKMHKFKKHIINNSTIDIDSETQELFTQLKSNRKITLRISDCIKTPLVFGLINPCIIFPATDMNIDEKRLALIHELTHIKNGDLWVKFVALIIISIHWFNPLAYLLRHKISVISEEYCDECVIKTMTKEERFLYGHLILKTISNITVPNSKFCSTLSAPTKNLKRRLYNMINIKKSSKSKIFLSIIAAFILFSMATTYAFAANINVNIIEPDSPESSQPNIKNDMNIMGIFVPDIIDPKINLPIIIDFNRESTISDVLEELNERLEKYVLNFDDEDIIALMEGRAYINIDEDKMEGIRSEFEEIKNNLDDIDFHNFTSFYADSLDILFEMVEEYFNTLIEAGSITQEKVDETLYLVFQNDEGTYIGINPYKFYIIIDNEGNVTSLARYLK